MKRLLFLVTICFFVLSCFGQDWAPLKQNDSLIHFLAEDSIRANHLQEDKFIYPIQSVVVDRTININGNSLKVLKKGYSSLWLDNYLSYQRSFIKGQMLGDTLTFTSDTLIVSTIDTLGFRLSFPYRYNLNSSWNFGKTEGEIITASVDSLFEMILPSIGLDSVVCFKLQVRDRSQVILSQHPFNETSVYISKNNGLISTPNFSNLAEKRIFNRYRAELDSILKINYERFEAGDEYVKFSSFSLTGPSYSNSGIGYNYDKIISDTTIGTIRKLTIEKMRYSKSRSISFPNTYNWETFDLSTVKDTIIVPITLNNYSCIIEDSLLAYDTSLIEDNHYGICKSLGANVLIRYKRDRISIFNGGLYKNNIPKHTDEIEIIGLGTEVDEKDLTISKGTFYKNSSYTYIRAGGLNFGVKPRVDCGMADTLVEENQGILKVVIDNASYQWLNCSNPDSILPIIDSTNQVFYPSQNGFYSVRVEAGICVDTSDCFSYPESFCSLGDSLISSTPKGLSALVDSASYRWLVCDNGYQLITDSTSKDITPSSSGTYAVEITKGICIDTSDCLYFEIPPCNFTDTLIVKTNLGFAATVDSASYQWLNCDSNFELIQDSTSREIIPTSSIRYAVEITKGNCKDTSRCITIVGLNENLNNNLRVRIYPNPANNKIKIESEINIQRVEIFDLQGKLQQEFEKHNQLDISTLESGIYFIKVYTAQGVISRKFIKE